MNPSGFSRCIKTSTAVYTPRMHTSKSTIASAATPCRQLGSRLRSKCIAWLARVRAATLSLKVRTGSYIGSNERRSEYLSLEALLVISFLWRTYFDLLARSVATHNRAGVLVALSAPLMLRAPRRACCDAYLRISWSPLYHTGEYAETRSNVQ